MYDFYFLYIVLHLDRHPELQPCVGTYIIRHLHRILSNSNKVGGHVSIGGLVTRLAHHFGVITDAPLPMSTTTPPYQIIDLDYLVRATLIRQEGTEYRNVTFEGHEFPLPAPAIVPSDRATWLGPGGIVPPQPPSAQPQFDAQAQPELMQFLQDWRTESQTQQTDLQRTIGDLSTQIGRQGSQITDLTTMMTGYKTRLDGFERRLEAIEGSSSTANSRFDDLYRYHDYGFQGIHEVNYLVSQMAQMHVRQQTMTDDHLIVPPRKMRPPTTYPFEWPPLTDDEDEDEDDPPVG